MNTHSKILLIDDEPDILQVVTLLLEAEGFKIETAKNGAEGFALIEKTEYDIVVSDYLMPKMDGLKLLKAVRDRGNYTSFIFFSGNASDEESFKMTNLGAYELLPKSELLNLADVLRRTLKKDAELREIRLDKTQESKDFLKLLHAA